MESTVLEAESIETEIDGRPSAEFLRAVAEFFETDASDLLSELGYVPGEAVVTDSELSR